MVVYVWKSNKEKYNVFIEGSFFSEAKDLEYQAAMEMAETLIRRQRVCGDIVYEENGEKKVKHIDKD